MAPTAYERLGGEWALRAVIHDFVDAMVDDAMIGFFFRGVDRHRLRDKEFELTARFLGASLPYTGKGLREAHRPHPIMGGQFDRRRQILVEAMARHRVPADVAREWLEHVDALRGVVTRDARGECRDPSIEPMGQPELVAGRGSAATEAASPAHEPGGSSEPKGGAGQPRIDPSAPG